MARDITSVSMFGEFAEVLKQKLNNLKLNNKLSLQEYNDIYLLHEVSGQILIIEKRKQLGKKRTKRIKELEDKIHESLDEAKKLNDELKKELGLDEEDSIPTSRIGIWKR